MQTEHTNRHLRSFGLTVGGIFLLIALWPLIRRGQDVRSWAILLAVALMAPAAVAPAILRGPYRLWMKIGHVLGWINTRIILSAIYYTVFTPVACVKKFAGSDPMNRKFFPNADTYRVPRQPRSPSHMRHQY